MINKIIVPFFLSIEKLLNNPKRVFYVCLLVIFASLTIDGTLFKLWSFHFKINEQQRELVEMDVKTKAIAAKIKQVSRPEFIEKQAREKFNMVNEGDLVFVFTNPSKELRHNSKKN